MAGGFADRAAAGSGTAFAILILALLVLILPLLLVLLRGRLALVLGISPLAAEAPDEPRRRAGRAPRPWADREAGPQRPSPPDAFFPRLKSSSRVFLPAAGRNVRNLNLRSGCWRALPSDPAPEHCYPAFANRAPRQPAAAGCAGCIQSVTPRYVPPPTSSMTVSAIAASGRACNPGP